MVRIVAVLAMLSVPVVSYAGVFAVDSRFTSGGVVYERYTNERFGFQLDYPVDVLRPQPPSETGDGRTFLSDDGVVQLLAWGANLVSGVDGEPGTPTVRDWYEAELAAAASPTYFVLRENEGWFVISGVADGDIYYRKSIAAPDGCGFLTFVLRYPASRADTFDPVATVVSHSFACER
ncbi:MAG: hypothetical protein H0U69_02420 [Trueperaceae bacterium]|nr:hypothetical protein [Trueperaceae bacterium]